ncbi:hypothetical protein [Millisia brevis]|uniref:hypothetical protein n=1 Tax=Millisia brevis TaxID=264148 RepID=UPI0008371A79|nr:hypothetical protein [Millisia brevis]
MQQGNQRRTTTGAADWIAQQASGACLDSVDIADFADPMTRVLLGGDGSTTLALEALLGVRLEVRVLHQDVMDSARLPEPMGRLLRSDEDATGTVLMRWSQLMDTRGRVVSANYVAVGGPTTPTAEATDPAGIGRLDRPIGHSIRAAGTSQRRDIVTTGTDRWRDGRRCATRSYLMDIAGSRRCFIRESFNPHLVPADLAETERPA